jgi:hypothetical protein
LELLLRIGDPRSGASAIFEHHANDISSTKLVKSF